MRSSLPSSADRSIFSLGTPDTMERSNSTPSSTPVRAPPRSPLNVDEEYDRAFKSKSFLDLWSTAHHHLRNTFSSLKRSNSSKSSFKGSWHGGHDDGDPEDGNAVEQSCSYTVLDDFVLEPSPEVLVLGRGSRLRRRRRRRVDLLLIEYFDVTQQACEACSELLAAIGAARRHHLTLRRLLCRMETSGASSDTRDALAEHVRLDNPLSLGRLSGFHDVQERCGPLATSLAAARRRLRRLARAVRVMRGTAAAALIAASAAAIVAAVIFAAHAVVGIGAAAAAVGAGPATAVRWAAEKVSERHYARAGATVDAAARGAYIVGRDMDTLSRMVRRAHDELEHGRDVARIAVRGHGELALLQEVAREEAECEAELRAQLEELEEHVCLCLITINRSRRMVGDEMNRGLPELNRTPSEN